LLPAISAPMPLQMALDELLFESQKKESQTPVLRFYVSSAPWISVGCSFRDPAALSKSDLILGNPQAPVCRRVTGGGCVLHGEDLIFSLAARTQLDPEKLGVTRSSYTKLHEGVKMGLQLCGVDPKFYGPEDASIKGNDCFDFPVESDLSWKGKKIAGGAQKRSQGVLLHHESIQAPAGIGRDELIRAIRKGMEEVFGISIQNADMDPAIYFEAERSSKGTSLRAAETAPACR
jgi:lipoate-protein ligase A